MWERASEHLLTIPLPRATSHEEIFPSITGVSKVQRVERSLLGACRAVTHTWPSGLPTAGGALS